MLEVVFFPKSFLYFQYFIVPCTYNPQDFMSVVHCRLPHVPLLAANSGVLLHVHMYYLGLTINTVKLFES